MANHQKITMPNIHPTAIVESGAELADDVVVGPYCHIGPKVVIGSGCVLKSHVAVMGRTTIGRNNAIWPFVSLGADPQDLKYKGEDSELIIGDHNDIRECAIIHKGTANDQGITRVGSHNLIMNYVHIGHDCEIGSHIVIANAVQLAGHICMEDHANIGGASAVHHFVTIGQYAYVAGMTRIVHDVPPYMVVEGNPSRVRKVNTTLLHRHQFSDEQIDNLKKAFRMLYVNGVGKTTEALSTLETQFSNCPSVQTLAQYLRRSGTSSNGRYREGLRRDNPFKNPVK